MGAIGYPLALGILLLAGCNYLPRADDGPPAVCDLSSRTNPKTLGPEIVGQERLTSDTVWQLCGVTRVAAGATLTIEPCTRIQAVTNASACPDRDDDNNVVSALVVVRGGRIVAEGTPERPILFTSARAEGAQRSGDWGGILILGNAPNAASDGVSDVSAEGLVDYAKDKFGGTGDDDDSGILRYVRIEYSGFSLSTGNELNGLTLASVGRGTTVDHVMVTSTQDDCFEFFGGTVNVSHLICNDPGDDMFDADLGYRGRWTHLLGRRTGAPGPESHGLELSNTLPADPIYEGKSPAIPTLVNGQGITLCAAERQAVAEPRPDLNTAIEPPTAVVVEDAVGAQLSALDVNGFEYGVDVRSADFEPDGEPLVVLSEAAFATFGETFGPAAGLVEGDQWFGEESWVRAGDKNRLGELPYGVDDCIDRAGPSAGVTGLDRGAFGGSADWHLDGKWVRWTH